MSFAPNTKVFFIKDEEDDSLQEGGDIENDDDMDL